MVGQIVRKARIDAGKTIGEVAKEIGLKSDQYLSNAELGKCPLSPKHFKPIAAFLGFDVNVLIDAQISEYVASLKQKVG